jgi:hypothetical protein
MVPLRYRSTVMKAVMLNGRSEGYDLVDDQAIGEGRHLSGLDDRDRRQVAVIGTEVAEELFGGADAALGRRIPGRSL